MIKRSNLSTNSESSGVVLVTVANPAVDVTPSSQVCKSCLIQQVSGTQAYLNIDAAATSSTWKLSSTGPISIPINNLNRLHFIGTAADVIQVLWRD